MLRAMRRKIGTAWLTPTSIEARLFANRSDESEQLMEILEDLYQSHARRYRLGVFGDRGIGKSILTSVILKDFAQRHKERIVRVEVNGRSIGFRRFLKALAGGLVENAKPLLPSLGDKQSLVAKWLDGLALFAHNDQITEGQINTLNTKYGMGAQLSADLIMALKATSSFSWEESRQQTGSMSRTQNVTDDLLHTALKATLQKIHDSTPWMVLVFFDDLDQAYTSDLANMKPALKAILDVDPCVGVVHMRTEMLFDDLRREMDAPFTIGPVDEQGLLAILEKRLDAASPEDRTRFRSPEVQNPLQRVISVTGNPHVLLRWIQGFLGSGLWPAENGAAWCADAALLDVVKRAAIVPGVDDEMLIRLAMIVDRCSVRGKHEVHRADLLQGRLNTAAVQDGKTITDDELEFLIRTGLLIPVDRFREEAGYRMDPLLDLLRPSIATRLRGS